MAKRALSYIAVFFLLVAAGLAGEYLAGLLPQKQILQNYGQSMKIIQEEGKYHYLLWNQSSGQNSYRLDNYTDGLILQHSVYMNTREHIDSVLTNPAARPEGDMDFQKLQELADSNAEPNMHYVRYWQGFRMIYRLLLSFISYGNIRQLLSYALLLLFTGCIVVLFKTTNSVGIVLAFAVSFALVNPILIGSSMQFFVCFGIAFLSMMFAARYTEKDEKLAMLFFIIGMATQFFDFYTVPIITFVYPAIQAVLGRRYGPRKVDLKKMWALLGRCFLLWFAAYAGMWLCKLALTTLLTDINGFENGWVSFARRIGINKVESLSVYYDAPAALARCMQQLFNSRVAKLLSLIAAGLVAGMLVWKRKNIVRENAGWAAVLGALAVLPVIWILVTAQPSSIHFWFQYRGLGAFLFGAGCSVLSLCVPKNMTIESRVVQE